MNATTEVSQVLAWHKELIEQKISDHIVKFGAKNQLRDACEYALLNGGKRFRPAIVLLVAAALGKGWDAIEAALAVEFFHCASLIADDLPCMDDDDLRREKASTHKEYGEATALLATYALIAAGYAGLQLNAKRMKNDRVGMLALENAAYNTGIFGATGGQFLDLFPSGRSEADLREIIQRKTISLFEISFVLGWLYGGGAEEQLEQVKKLAYHFGMAFQIADDMDDVEQDVNNERSMNMAIIAGKEMALAALRKEILHYQTLLQELNIDSPELKGLSMLILQAL